MALGNKALTSEDAKANALGLYFVCKLIDEHKNPALITKEDAITTFVANLIRSAFRRGLSSEGLM